MFSWSSLNPKLDEILKSLEADALHQYIGDYEWSPNYVPAPLRNGSSGPLPALDQKYSENYERDPAYVAHVLKMSAQERQCSNIKKLHNMWCDVHVCNNISYTSTAYLDYYSINEEHQYNLHPESGRLHQLMHSWCVRNKPHRQSLPDYRVKKCIPLIRAVVSIDYAQYNYDYKMLITLSVHAGVPRIYSCWFDYNKLGVIWKQNTRVKSPSQCRHDKKQLLFLQP